MSGIQSVLCRTCAYIMRLIKIKSQPAMNQKISTIHDSHPGSVLNPVPELRAAAFLCVHGCASPAVGEHQSWAQILIMALQFLSL